MERPAAARAADVVHLEATLAVARRVQHRDGVGAERCVEVDAEHAACRPDPLRHEAHRLAGAAAGIQAARPRRQPDLVQEPPGRRLPPARLTAQPLVLLTRPPQGIDVGARLLLGGTHRCRLPSRCQTTGTIRSAGSPACLTVAATTSGDDAQKIVSNASSPGTPAEASRRTRHRPAGCCAAEPAAEQLDATSSRPGR